MNGERSSTSFQVSAGVDTTGALVATAERAVSRAKEQIVLEAKRLEERTGDSAKGHNCAAEVWSKTHFWLGLPTVVLSTIVSASAFASAASSNDSSWIAIAGGIMSTIVTVLTGIVTWLNPKEREAAHLAAANAYDRLNNEARIFHTIDCWGEDPEELLTDRLRKLVEQKNELNSNSPQIPPFAWKMAKKRLAAGEGTYTVDKPAAPQG